MNSPQFGRRFSTTTAAWAVAGAIFILLGCSIAYYEHAKRKATAPATRQSSNAHFAPAPAHTSESGSDQDESEEGESYGMSRGQTYDSIGVGRGADRSGRAKSRISGMDRVTARRGVSVECCERSRFRTPAPSNDFVSVFDQPLSTLSTDVDTASYTHVRREIENSCIPARGDVRVEEMLNYFKYEYPAPANGDAFAAYIESAECPWSPGREIVRIGLKARVVPDRRRKPSNIVFLLDVSGSMSPESRLPLVQAGIARMLDSLQENDQVGIVTYAGESGVALETTSVSQKDRILQVLNGLVAAGSTNGGAGIVAAYAMARRHFTVDGNNRVILATDGDFNVGVHDSAELERLVSSEAASGVYLTVLGVGDDCYKDAVLERIADHGNGVYAYVDRLSEARRLLAEQCTGTLQTVAKDAKLQIEFNPRAVRSYRLLGYEDRRLRAADFNDDSKDAGDVGAGQCVTVLYEISRSDVPGAESASVDPLKYQTAARGDAEMLTLKIRYKEPGDAASRKLEYAYCAEHKRFADASRDFRFQCAVAAFGAWLRDGRSQAADIAFALKAAEGAIGDDPAGSRRECIDLMMRARGM